MEKKILQSRQEEKGVRTVMCQFGQSNDSLAQIWNEGHLDSTKPPLSKRQDEFVLTQLIDYA